MTGDKVAKIIVSYIADGEINQLGGDFGEPAWDKPLVGYSRGDDVLYNEFKEAVDPSHWTPAEAFALAFPESPAEAGELTVVSWVLPQRKAAKQDNRKETFYPSERWVRSRVIGESINDGLRRKLVQELEKAGIQALAPPLLPDWKTVPSERFGLASLWSERHAAYASGLGTFGLSEGLITERGKAHRVGSVIARMSLPATPRPYRDHHEYCLFYGKEGSCSGCIDRCPVGAITVKGHEKMRCLHHTATVCRDYAHLQFRIEGGYGCGLCQTGVPCESRIPRRRE